MFYVSRNGQAEILDAGFIKDSLEVLLILDRHRFRFGFAFKDLCGHSACDLAEFVVINCDRSCSSAFDFAAFTGKDRQLSFFCDLDQSRNGRSNGVVRRGIDKIDFAYQALSSLLNVIDVGNRSLANAEVVLLGFFFEDLNLAFGIDLAGRVHHTDVF